MFVYCDGVYDITPQEYDFLFSKTDETRRERVLRYRREEDRILSVCAYGLLLYTLRRLGFSVHDLKFSVNKYGKPYAEGADFHFNLSHTENAVACAVEDEPVGIDIQRLAKNHKTVMYRMCTEAEVTALLSAGNPAGYFTKLWTLKESYVKCRGSGIWDNLNRLDFSHITAENGTCLGHRFSTGNDGDLYLAACCEHRYIPMQKVPISDVIRYLKDGV